MPPNPAYIVLGVLIGGHGAPSKLRLARAAETLTGSDGTFVFPAFTQEEQINQGPIVLGGAAVIAFLPGYEPQNLQDREVRLYRYGAKPDRPATVENLRSFLNWLEENVGRADGSMEVDTVLPGEPAPQEGRRRELARSAQTTAFAMLIPELRRLVAKQPPSPPTGRIVELSPAEQRKAGIKQIEIAATESQSVAVSSGGYVAPPPATPQADAEQAFRAGNRQPRAVPVCTAGYEIPPDCLRAAMYAEEYNRTLAELARQK